VRKPSHPIPTDRSFGLTFACIFGIVGAWLFWRGNGAWQALAIIAALFLVCAIVRARVLHPLNVAWMAFGLLLNRIVSPVVMGIIYFGVLTPVAAWMRLRGRDALQRRFDPERTSYWIEREPPGPDASSFPRQF
jgi:predicted membrane metal-binding protein